MPAEQEKEQPKPPMREELAKEAKKGFDLTAPDRLPKDKVSLQSENPMFFNSAHDAEFKQKMKSAAEKHIQKPLEQCSQLEKAKALVFAIRDPSLFAFSYERVSTEKPRTVEDAYLQKKGNCDELSRFFLIAADKLGIKDVAQYYAMFEHNETKAPVGHVAILYVSGTVVAIDPAFTKFDVFEKTYKRPEDVLKDSDFKKYVSGLVSEIAPLGKHENYTLTALGVIKKRENQDAFYYYNLGVFLADNGNWKDATPNLLKALEKGLMTRNVHLQIADSYLYTGDNVRALSYYQKAAVKIKTADDYLDIGRCLFELKRYNDAKTEFKELLRLYPANIDAKFALGATYNEIGLIKYKRKEYLSALFQFEQAGMHLFSVLKNLEGKNEGVTPEMQTTLEAFFTNKCNTL